MVKHTCTLDDRTSCSACELDFATGGGFVPREELRSTSTDASPSSSAEVGIPAGRPGAPCPANSSPPWLPDLLAILGWQGGTIHQALDEVRKLREVADSALEIEDIGSYFNQCGEVLTPRLTSALNALDIRSPKAVTR